MVSGRHGGSGDQSVRGAQHGGAGSVISVRIRLEAPFSGLRVGDGWLGVG